MQIPEKNAQISSHKALTSIFGFSDARFARNSRWVLARSSKITLRASGGQVVELEVVDALTSMWGGYRVAVRIGPPGRFNGMSDSDPHALFAYVADALNRFGLAYLPACAL